MSLRFLLFNGKKNEDLLSSQQELQTTLGGLGGNVGFGLSSSCVPFPIQIHVCPFNAGFSTGWVVQTRRLHYEKLFIKKILSKLLNLRYTYHVWVFFKCLL